jgi:phage gp36-like protein
MAYVTQAELVTRFGTEELTQLTDRADTGAPDAGVVSAHIADAESVVDSYIGQRVQLPMAAADIPPSLKSAAARVARYFLWGDRAPEHVRKGYEDSIAWLKDISTGRAGLGVDAQGEAAAAAVSMEAELTSEDRLFTSAALNSY